jgi:glutamate carboxypeptidase
LTTRELVIAWPRCTEMDRRVIGAVRAFVDAHAAEQLDFTIGLCNENSYTHNPAGTNRVAAMLLDRLGGLLPNRQTIPQEGVGNHHLLSTGPDRRGVYLLGHMDTVFPPDHPFQTCAVKGEWLHGPGSGDMKGGLAVIVYALLGLHEMGILEDLEATLILSADEEIGAVTSRALYEEERTNARACLVAECAGPHGEVVTSRNGKAGLRLECRGAGSHVGRVSDRKRSAILEMAHKVIALEALNGCLAGVTVNVGTIEGGLGPCTVPPEARALVDVRWRNDRDYDTVLAKVCAIVSEPICPGCECRVRVLNQRPAMAIAPGNEALYETLVEVAALAGITVGKEHRRGTSDANFFGSAGVPTLDGLGPVCHDDHTPDERIHIPSLAERTTLVALLLADLASR